MGWVRRLRASTILVAVMFIAVACTASTGDSSSPSTTAGTVTSSDTSLPESTTTTATSVTVIYDFSDPASIRGWSNVDDSVMGGISESRTTWQDGAMVFEGLATTESNGGFVSTIGPSDPDLGPRLRGAAGLAIGAQRQAGPSGEWLVWLRAAEGARYVASFTPLEPRICCAVPIAFSSFVSVDRFLRELPGAEPIDPSTIEQVGFYLLPSVVRGDFRLNVTSIEALR